MPVGPISPPNLFTAYGLHRYHKRLGDAAWVDQQLHAPTTRFLVVKAGEPLIVPDEPPRAATFTADETAELLPQAESITLLGSVEGRCYAALGLQPDGTMPTALRARGIFQNLRHVAPLIDRHSAGLLAYAQAMTYWHCRHRFCGLCGHPTESVHGGHLRRCTHPGCEAEHFPRVDPAIIVLVTHEDRCLLARQPHWPPRRYSILAGFVEPGESLEDAVAREVWEETGVILRAVVYQSSQPWPFPASLMLGFTAEAADPHIRRHDGELEDARWLSREALQNALRSGEIELPSSISISRHLITQWFDADSLGPPAGARQDDRLPS
ncbi:MAG: NAD(+) diphosphatase [Anaerolineae bacterium]